MRGVSYGGMARRMTFAFLIADNARGPVAAYAAPFPKSRRTVAIICVALSDADWESYAIHRPKMRPLLPQSK